MLDFQQKRQFKKIAYSKITFVVLFILVVFLARSTFDIYQKYRVSSDNLATVKKDYDNLKARRDMLDSEIGRLNTDSGIEEEIRGKFNVAKPGETVVMVINSSSSSSTGNNNSKSGFWSGFLNLFK